MSKVKVIPCSGIGKVYGLMAREVALATAKEDDVETVCLAHVVSGAEEAVDRVKGKACITIDGCSKLCAAKAVEYAGGKIAASYRTMNEMKKHKGVQPGTPSALTEDGWHIVDELSREVKEKIKETPAENA